MSDDHLAESQIALMQSLRINQEELVSRVTKIVDDMRSQVQLLQESVLTLVPHINQLNDKMRNMVAMQHALAHQLDQFHLQLEYGERIQAIEPANEQSAIP